MLNKIYDDGTTLMVEDLSGRTDTFRLVDRVPHGYLVWNIGGNMPDGYLPLCRLAAVQPFPGGQAIDRQSLLAIRCPEAQTILAAVCYGTFTLSAMEKFVQRHGNAHLGSRYYEPVRRMKKALPFMRQIQWDEVNCSHKN